LFRTVTLICVIGFIAPILCVVNIAATKWCGLFYYLELDLTLVPLSESWLIFKRYMEGQKERKVELKNSQAGA